MSAHPQRIHRSPGSCTSCLRTDSSVTVCVVNTHGAVLLCENCRDFADAKGWLQS
jgi:hypothetical protein